MSTERTPLLSDMEISKASWRSTSVTTAVRELIAIRSIYEAARAKDRELIQMAVDAMAQLDFLHECELEGMASGQPSARDWRKSFSALNDALAAAKAAGFTPTTESE